MQKLIVSALLGLALAGSAIAAEQCEKDQGPFMMFPYRLFHGSGEHQCWSKDFIGYKCIVNHAAVYTDCQAAFFGMKKDNCCSRMYWQGRRLEDGTSIDFKLTKCSNWT
jgi:hypothetical protein